MVALMTATFAASPFSSMPLAPQPIVNDCSTIVVPEGVIEKVSEVDTEPPLGRPEKRPLLLVVPLALTCASPAALELPQDAEKFTCAKPLFPLGALFE